MQPILRAVATTSTRWRPMFMGGSFAIASTFAFTEWVTPAHELTALPPVVVELPDGVRADATWAPRMFGDSLYGASGKLRFRALSPNHWQALPVAFEHPAPAPGIYPATEDFAFIAMRPFHEKSGASVGNYRVGFWPAELRIQGREQSRNPDGFIEVTRSMRSLRLSEHFTIGDFLTHDQPEVWPKYLVLREELIDKLELVIQELRTNGIRADRITVTSGFRTPHHNQTGVEGAARDSRHQFGDAADIIIDNGNGRMADLDNDGRVDVRDLDLVLRAVEMVEARYPHLVGGLGRYHAIGPRGPFAHIDVRGERARWGNEARPVAARSGSRPAARGTGQSATAPRSSCKATGPSAVLCSSIRHSANR